MNMKLVCSFCKGAQWTRGSKGGGAAETETVYKDAGVCRFFCEKNLGKSVSIFYIRDNSFFLSISSTYKRR